MWNSQVKVKVTLKQVKVRFAFWEFLRKVIGDFPERDNLLLWKSHLKPKYECFTLLFENIAVSLLFKWSCFSQRKKETTFETNTHIYTSESETTIIAVNFGVIIFSSIIKFEELQNTTSFSNLLPWFKRWSYFVCVKIEIQTIFPWINEKFL